MTDVRLRAAPADTEAHAITVRRDGDGYVLTDSAGIIDGSDICVAVDATTMRCAIPPLELGTLGKAAVAAGAAGDSIFLSNLAAEVRGLAGPDLLSGGSQGDTLVGGSGSDRLLGKGRADTLFGGSGDDLLIGGTGNDGLLGQRGIDVLKARDGQRDDPVNCGAGNDDRERAVRDRSDSVARSC